MDYKDVYILAILVAVCSFANISCCEEEEVVTCRRENMTCVKSLCHCTNTAPIPDYSYFTSVSCSDLTEVPKDLPKGVFVL